MNHRNFNASISIINVLKTTYSLLLACFIASNVYGSGLDDVTKYANTIPILQGHKTEVTPLSGGLTNLIYQVKREDGANYVLRMFGHEADLLGINPSAQADIAVEVGNLGVGPKVVYFSADKRRVLLNFVPGSPLTKNKYNKTVRANIMHTLRRMHENANFATVFNPFESANKFKLLALSKDAEIVKTFPVADILKAHQIMLHIEPVLNPHSGKFIRSAHNDLHCGNILHDAENDIITLIDFDYAGQADLFFDLAILSNSLGLDQKESKELLSAYFNRSVSKRDEAHLALMKVVSTYWNSMWYFSQVGSSGIEHNHLQDAKDNLITFFITIKGSQFNDWVNILVQKT